MLVVVSDLHMEEEASNFVLADPDLPPIRFSRNLSPKAYWKVFADLALEARRNQARAMHLVLAGDIFDLHRTSLWFRDNPTHIRPYVDATEVGGALEAKVLAILDGIAAEPRVADALHLLQLLAGGEYWDEQGELQPFPVPVTIHYIAGNHDRLANSRPAIRRKVRQLLGLPATPEPFARSLYFADEQALVRHGHEYDPYNFAVDLREVTAIDIALPVEYYNAAPIGDFVTVDVASALPVLIRAKYGDPVVQSDPILRAIYERSIAFDDLRPQRAMLQYLLHMPQKRIDPEKVWGRISDIVADLLEDLHDDPFLNGWLGRLDDPARFDLIDVVQAMLELKTWRWGRLSLTHAEKLSRELVGEQGGPDGAELFAARETAVLGEKARFVIAGHTHRPRMALLKHDEDGERYYIDTGTWRNRITANATFTAFGSLKALTYAVVYGREEDLGSYEPGAKVASVDMWTGLTQRW
jgi:UDP-2,3-diacylglucosamine pyrophosphatase LpxH